MSWFEDEQAKGMFVLEADESLQVGEQRVGYISEETLTEIYNLFDALENDNDLLSKNIVEKWNKVVESLANSGLNKYWDHRTEQWKER